MTLKNSTLKWIAIILIAAVFVVAAYLMRTYRKSLSPTITEHQTIEQPTSTDPGRAFVTLGEAPSSVSRGGTWELTMETNPWASCLTDVYRPNGIVSQFADPKQAEASPITPGRGRWTWQVPQDAEIGRWTITVLCGTFENLATADVTVEVE